MRLETERLTLRSWEERDRAPLASILGDPEVRRFYPSALTPEQAGAQLDFAMERQAAVGVHFGAAELRSTGRLVGLIGLAWIPDETRDAIPGRPAVEIGWQFDKSLWGQGLAPEGARAWLEHGFDALGLSEIVAFTFRGNLPSQRVMTKIGMTRDPAGDFEHPRLPPGHPLRPHVLYRISRA
ncbi:GNAT family N-acetyltransferase [Devosia sp.]|uniref:GNAT family N-acetyltransferase n=1 Tax=Devosia sp. TaxID=1871048 RepID=UPI001AC6B461|nr:GNAT family N-acetyltransferase [Devosia sp.]MBN9309344.1 GNAT family N-acetyltransferase [Devosia sp.]